MKWTNYSEHNIYMNIFSNHIIVIEVMGENHWTSLKESYQRHQKSIWFYTRGIDYGGDFFDNATYGEM
jgi:hypothetical protein